ncbi:MAG: type II toxin-antitoxin system VapC family toxin [Halobacteriaceae archaeon]
MAEIVVDTSIVVKWYIPEQHHETARALRDDYLDGQIELIAPALMPFEAINALKYSGLFNEEQLEEVALSLSEYGIEFIPFSEIGAIAEIATDLDITVYDATYIALAQKLDTTVYTADQTLLEDLDEEYSPLGKHIRTYP